MKKVQLIIFITFFSLSIFSCINNVNHESKNVASREGKLFIIGGGSRPETMLKSMIQISGIDSAGYAVVLPMASEETDTASYYSSIQFIELGIKNIFAMNFQNAEDMGPERLDSIRNAKLIYISGGDQNRFMKIVLNSPVYDAIHQAFKNGALIAGTSAGAAVMSKKMITGNEIKHPEYTGNFRTIESNNIEIKEGLGLNKSIIVDQHFIKRMRMNRLIATCLENPMETCIGIDESTAILIEGDKATVYGESQVIVLKHTTAETKIMDGFIGGEKMELNVYLPGDCFKIEKL